MFVMFVPAQHVQLSGSMPLVLQVRNARVSHYKRVGILLHKSVSESVWDKGMPFSVMVNVRKLPYICMVVLSSFPYSLL